ncbi:type II CRISPR RNA-guided endonuclease Cas9 [Urechidicola croceus]|uniref:CRISPR-associated endonuclease Cas9 n=1 Tax=Urechidicola croceus TaxID=1850246 RepID=A0A1D8P523_9FLAO|nr:type II CRISPR RNA-guided endonuclease Cas9 [Urechidicola croceus]AOW19677.1 type II CRISPR RNA-guided endonuclease Cas9 [Urechidicola croceus]
MKRILGLDLGTASIGWALVNESENEKEKSEIIKLGVRVNPLTTDEQTDFEKGRPLSVNADRTLKRGARRNLQRFKQRRKNLIEILIKKGFITNISLLTEIGSNTTYQTLELRAKSVKEKIEKEEFARVLLTINKKRGYKSSRKAKNDEEGSLIDGMSVAKELYDNNLTVGQYVYQLLEKGGKYIPDFYRSDLQNEFDVIWNFQKEFYPNILTGELYKKLQGQGQQNSRKLFLAIHQIYTAENKGKRDTVKKQHYKWRNDAINTQLLIEEVAYVLVEINNNLNKSSGYLGAISDRSKELYFNKETVGENLYKQIQENPQTSLKNQVFYRQDYLDEFEQIWETQAKFYSELTKELKEEVRDVVIFYQRKLKSQKHLISECEFEKHHKAIPKSSPLFQEFKIWQILNNIEFKHKKTKELKILSEELKETLFEELNIRGNFTSDAVLKFVKLDKKEWELNYKKGIEGNRTNEVLYNVYQKIAEYEGYGFDWSKKSAVEIKEELNTIFSEIGINSKILDFNPEISGNDFDKQESYQLWHLLYSAEEDGFLKQKLQDKYGFKSEYANMLANVSFQSDYGSLSARAIKKILPNLIAGHEFSEACSLSGYNHSNSLTKEELANRPLKGKLELLKKNSLRNPVVEKILNQMVNLVNQVIESYGEIDEVRIELARELKKSAQERALMTTNINASKTKYESFRKLLQKDFGIKNPTRNDIIKYRLYEELKANKYHTIYTNKYIPRDKLFSKEIDIEHIIPKAKLFDDSFSNKTLAFRKPNQDKGNMTAIDYILSYQSKDIDNYKSRIENLFKNGKGDISKAKRNKLLMEEKDIPDGFIDRDLRNSQYIAKKAKQLLEEVIRTVNTTTGSVTNKLRDDWGLINVMQELNMPKFKAIDESLIEQIEKKDGTFKTRIKDWSKRNDHRHHAMDALTVAFTRYNHIQYLNNLNAKSDKKGAIYGIQELETYVNSKGKRKFIKPMHNFREEAKKHIEDILISFKAKNKVVTKNINKIKSKDGFIKKVQLTPRGQLHKETVYGKINEVVVKEEKINAKFDLEKINKVTKPIYRNALLKRLQEFNGEPKKAFTGKNSLSKNPIYLDVAQTKTLPESVKVQFFEENYTIRKEISPDLKIDKIIDKGIQRILLKRLDEFNGKPKEAFSNLEKNPIWLNKEKGIAIKRVKIKGVKNVESLHNKRDHLGNEILQKGKSAPNDYVSTGNNHHVAIYQDKNGKLQEKVVSFYEAVARVNNKLPIIDQDFNKDLGWKFLFTMKQNEMFVFPSEDFKPLETDLMDKKNNSKISKNLFRVQKLGNKDYTFRHHLETKIEDIKKLRDFTYIRKRNPESIKNIIKVRINHLGNIVHVGEY